MAGQEASGPVTGPLERITELAHLIMDECPSCVAHASEITTWAAEIRERRPALYWLAWARA